MPHQNAALGIWASPRRHCIGDNQTLALVDHGNSLDLDEQVFLEESLLERRACRARGLEMAPVDVIKGLIKRPLAGPGRTTMLGQEGAHLDHVLEAAAQEF